jgi:hypothetical protein
MLARYRPDSVVSSQSAVSSPIIWPLSQDGGFSLPPGDIGDVNGSTFSTDSTWCAGQTDRKLIKINAVKNPAS